MSPLDTPPHEYQIEQALLGMLMLYENAHAEGFAIITPALFYDRAHRTIFLALQQMHQERQKIDKVLLEHRLRKMDQFDEVGGYPYTAKLYSHAVNPTFLREYTGQLRDAARRRGQLEIAAKLSAQAGRMDMDAAEVARAAIQQLKEPDLWEEAGQDGSPAALAERVMEDYQAAERLAQSGRDFAGLDTGFRNLSYFVNGLNRAEMTIIAARPSIGKTTLALQIAHHVAKHEGQGVGIFSLEMSAAQVAGRLTGILAGVDPDTQRRGQLAGEARDRLYEAVAEYARLPIHVWQDREMPAIRARIAQARREQDICLYIIDHLHRIKGPGEEYERLNAASEDVANLAIELDCPILLLSQLNRECENRSDKRPQLADLRGSGGIEEHAVNVWMIYRPGFYEDLRRRPPDDSDEQEKLIRDVHILVEKQRFGQVGDVPLAWVPEKALFGNPAPASIERRSVHHANNQ